ncbi:MAG: EpsG family protein, partial [Deltaproteobacteria bacterium]
MIGALIFNIIAVIFAWLESTGQYKHGLKLSLFTVFLFLALRYSYGNDYWNYFYMFMDTNSSSSFGESILREGWEIGWLFINRVFGLLGTQGFFAMIAVLAAFNCIVLFRFIKKYVPPKHYWIAVFIYTFQPDMMLILSSAMRQAVAVSLFLLSIDFIIQKKILPYLILVTIATIFHTSSIVLYTFILLVFGDWKINFRELIIVFVLFMIQFIYFNVIHEYTTLITNKYFWAYTKHLSEAPDLEVV